MNKNRYRIIFSKAKNMFIAVAENIKSQSKTSGQTAATNLSVETDSTSFHQLWQVKSIVASMSLFMAFSPVYANIQVDPGAAAANRAVIGVGKNAQGQNVPVVNIQTAKNGISHNVYKQFDVLQPGVVLNNSRGGAKSVIVGNVAANPFLNTGEARVILNEVNSTAATQFLGNLEVAGQRADVIIANPSGIVVNGGGFINANKGILTTGKPQMNADGSLKQFVVDQGKVTINGGANNLGLGGNNNNAEFVDIYARALEMNAQLHAKQGINVITGANTISADLENVTDKTSTAAKPALAVDVKALGGMYANNIYIMGTEKGLGVSNAGTLRAANNLVVTSAGQIQHSGTMESTSPTQGMLSIQTTGTGAEANITSSGLISSKGLLNISSGNDLNITAKEVKVDVGTVSPLILSAKGNLNVAAKANVRNFSTDKGDIYLDGKNITVGEGALIGGNGSVNLNATDGNVLINKTSSLSARYDLGIQAKDSINIDSSSIWATKGDVNLISLGTKDTSFLNITNTKLSSGKDFNISGANNVKLNSSIVQESSSNINLYANNNLDIGDDINKVNFNTSGNINIATKNNLVLRTDTTFKTKKDIEIKTEVGDIYAKSLNINSTEGGVFISSNKNITLDTLNSSWNNTLKNRITSLGDIVISSGGEGVLKLNTVDINSTNGGVLLVSNKELTIDGNNEYETDAYGSSGKINANNVKVYSVNGVVDVSSGEINSKKGDILISSGKDVVVHDIDLNSKRNIEIHSDKNLNLERSNIIADHHIALSSKKDLRTFLNYALKAEGILSLISGGIVDGNGSGGTVLIEANELSDEFSYGFSAHGSEFLKNDNKLSSINGNLSVLLNKDFILKPLKSNGRGAWSLSALNDIDIRSKQGKIEFIGDLYFSSTPTPRFIDIKSLAGGLSLEGTTVDLKGVKIKTEKDINIVSTKGDFNADGVFGDVYLQTQKKDLFDKQDDQEKKIFTSDNVYGKENYNSELISNKGNINISSKKGISISGTDIDSKSGTVNIQAQSVLDEKYKSTAVKLGDQPKTINASIIIDGNVDVYEKGKETDPNYSYREYINPTNINGQKGVNIRAMGTSVNDNLVLQGVAITSAQGDVNIEANKSILFDSALEKLYDRSTKTETKRSWYGKKKTITTTSTGDIVTPASVDIYGKNINVLSSFKNPTKADGTRDPALKTSIDIYSARFNADGGKVSIRSGGDLNFLTVKEVKNSNVNTVKKSSWLGVNLGTSKTNATRNQTTEIPAKLEADYITTRVGYDTRLDGTEFKYLKGANIESGGTITLNAIKDRVEETLKKEKNSVVWQSMQDKGSITETAKLPSFNGPTAPTFKAVGGLTVQIPVGEKDQNKTQLKDEVLKLANQPGNQYLKDLVNRNDVDWQKVILTQKDWDYKSQGLTGAGAAILVIIVTAVTMGAGSAGAGAALFGTTGTTTTAMANAFVTSLASQASVSLVNNGGDVGKTLKELGSKNSVQNLVASVATAGLLSQVGSALNLKPDSTLFSDRLMYNFTTSVGSTLVQTAVKGGDLEENLKVALLSGLAGALQGELARFIGDHSNKLNPDVLEYTVHKIAHAAVGCATAAATKASCEAGAIGAGVGEIVASLMPDPANGIEYNDTEKLKIRNTGKIVAGVISAYAGYDVNTAANSADIAIQNNSFVRLATTTGKLLVKAADIYGDLKKVYKNQPVDPKVFMQKLKDQGASELVGIADDLITVFGPASTPFDRALAAIDLVVGTDLKPGKGEALKLAKTEMDKLKVDQTHTLKVLQVKKDVITRNRLNGKEYELSAASKLGVQRNTNRQMISVKTERDGDINIIPDAFGKGDTLIEFKNVKYLSDTQQFRGYAATNKPIILVINPDTKYSDKILKVITESKGKIYTFDQRTNSLKTVKDFSKS